LGEPDTNTRFAESRKLLDYGFANYELTEVGKKGQEVGSVVVKKGLKIKANGVYEDDVRFLVKKGEKGEIKKEAIMSEDITAPVKVGQKVGEVVFKLGDKEIGKTNIVSADNIEKASFIRLFFRMILQWFGVGRQ
jgi:D-alanyl-D-alanine carboxypeptidase (penicillin-binding protein 5/6)